MQTHSLQLNSEALQKIKSLLYEVAGIYISDAKQTMIQNRINMLMQEPALHGITTFDALLQAVRTNANVKQAFINSFTTNKTDLFRESYHFDDMLNRVLIPLLQANQPIKILCSASSSGEEPYSIAATCLYAKGIYKSSSPIKIIATDIDTTMLDLARKGEYIYDPRLNRLPSWVKLEEYFDILHKLELNVVKIRAKVALKSMITFQQLNLFNKTYPFSHNEFDIVFCRNVLIYFKQKDQEDIIAKLHNILKIQGTLYLGHSENVLGLSGKFDRLGNKIFIRNSETIINVFEDRFLFLRKNYGITQPR